MKVWRDVHFVQGFGRVLISLLIVCLLSLGAETSAFADQKSKLALSIDSVTVLCEKASKAVKISGGKEPYSISLADSNIVKNDPIAFKMFHLYGKLPGTTVVTVKDSLGETATLKVTVEAPPLSATPAEILIDQPDGIGKATMSGVKPFKYYFGEKENNLKDDYAEFYGLTYSDMVLKVHGKRPGSTVMTIKDATGRTIKVKIVVGGPPMKADPESVAIQVGEYKGVFITGGAKPYSFSSGGDAIKIEADPKKLSARVQGVKQGETTLNVKDSAGKTLAVKVVVQASPIKAFPTALNMLLGTGIKDVFVSGGTKPYAFSANNDNVKVTASDKSPEILKVSASKPGETLLNIRDQGGRTVSVKVVVEAPPFSVEPAARTIKFGTVTQILIKGGFGPYSASLSGDSVKTADSLPASIYLKGVKAGQAVLTVRDAQGRTASSRITVEAPPPLTAAPASIAAKILIKREVIITGGVKPYTFSISGDAARVERSAEDKLSVIGVKAGEAMLTVKDAAAQTAGVKISITGIR